MQDKSQNENSLKHACLSEPHLILFLLDKITKNL